MLWHKQACIISSEIIIIRLYSVYIFNILLSGLSCYAIFDLNKWLRISNPFKFILSRRPFYVGFHMSLLNYKLVKKECKKKLAYCYLTV